MKVFRVTKEHAFDGARLKFVRLSGRNVGIESATEGAKMIVCRFTTIKRESWGSEVESFGRKDIMEICSRMECFDPK